MYTDIANLKWHIWITTHKSNGLVPLAKCDQQNPQWIKKMFEARTKT